MVQFDGLFAKTLATLVDSRHLSSAAIARLRHDEAANRHWVVDNFLAPHLLPLIREVVEHAGDFEDNLKLAPAARAPRPAGYDGIRGKVDKTTFEAAPESDRFIRQQRLIGMRPGFEGSRAAKAEAFVRRMLASRPLHQWLDALTGISVSQTGGINLKLHRPGDFLRPHSDARPGRKLCAVIYTHADWAPVFDGRFVLHCVDGTHKRIDPLPNRMIVFDVMQENVHAIEPLGHIPKGWLRVNYTAWFA